MSFLNFKCHQLFYSQIHFCTFPWCERVHVSIVPYQNGVIEMCFIVTLQRMGRVSTRKRSSTLSLAKFFVIGVLVVGGCYRRTCATRRFPYKCRHVVRCLLSIDSIAIGDIADHFIHSGLTSCGIYTRMLALPSIVALSFVAFFASAGTNQLTFIPKDLD